MQLLTMAVENINQNMRAGMGQPLVISGICDICWAGAREVGSKRCVLGGISFIIDLIRVLDIAVRNTKKAGLSEQLFQLGGCYSA